MQQILLKNSTTGKQIIIQPQNVLTDNLDQRLPNKSGTLQTETDLNAALNGYVNNLSTPTPVVDNYSVSGLEGSTITVNITNYVATNIYYINISNTDVCTADIKNSVITINLATVQTNSATTITITANSSGKTQSGNCAITVINNIVPTSVDTTLSWINGVDANDSSATNTILTDIANQGTGEGDWLSYQNSVDIALTNNIFLNDDGTNITVNSQLNNGDIITTGNNDNYVVGAITSINTNPYSGFPCVFDCNSDIDRVNLLKTVDTNIDDAGVKFTSLTNLGYSGPGYGCTYVRTATRLYAIGGSAGNTIGTSFDIFSMPLSKSFYKVLNSDGSIPATAWIEDTANTFFPIDSALSIFNAKSITIKNTVFIIGGTMVDSTTTYPTYGTVNTNIFKATVDNNGVLSTMESPGALPVTLRSVSLVYTLNNLYIAGYVGDSTGKSAYMYNIKFNTDLSIKNIMPITIPPLPANQNVTTVSMVSTPNIVLTFKTKDRMYLLITSGGTYNSSETATLYYSNINSDGSVVTFISTGYSITINPSNTTVPPNNYPIQSSILDNYNIVVASNVVYVIRDYYQNVYTNSTSLSLTLSSHTIKIPLDTNNRPISINLLLNTYQPSMFFGTTFVNNFSIYKIGDTGNSVISTSFDGWIGNINNNLSTIVNYAFLKAATTPAINTLVNKVYQLPTLKVLTAATSAGIATAVAIADTISNISTISTVATVNYAIQTVSAGFRSIRHLLNVPSAQVVINKISTVMTKRQDNTGNTTSGNQIFTTSGTFTVPNNITAINVIMCGGGGGGSTTDNKGAGGGYAGQVITITQTVNPGDIYSINIGAGGVGAIATAYAVGVSGSNTTLYHGGLLVGTATGGLPGTLNSSVTGPKAVTPYSGNGEASVTSLGTARNGYADTSVAYIGGGQSSGYANGGDAGGGNGGIGSGGAGNIYQSGKAGDGGNGIVIISW